MYFFYYWRRETTFRGECLMLKSILFVILIALSSVARAQNQCMELFSKPNDLPVPANENIPQGEKKPTPIQVRERELKSISLHITWEVGKWNILVGEYAVKKVGLKLLEHSIRGSYFSPLSRYIGLGIELEGKPEVLRDVIMAHEYSHAIFNDNFVFEYDGERVSLKTLSMDAKANLTSLRQNPVYLARVEEAKDIERTLIIAQKVGDKEISAKLEALLTIKMEALNSMTRALDIYNHVSDILISYNELFADSIPAIIWKDPHIMTKAVEPTETDFLSLLQYELMYRGRNRGVPLPRDFEMGSFKEWKHEVADAYTMLDPARGFLWKMYMEGLRPANIPVFIKTFLEATSLHITERLKGDKDIRVSAQADDATQVNKEFVRLFVEAAERNGLPIRKID